MISTSYNLNDPRLPQGVVTMNQAIEQTDNSILAETMELSIENGYFLKEVRPDGYTLEKLEVAE